MPGIVGLVSPTERNQLSESLTRMALPMQRRAEFQVTQKVDSIAGFGNVSLDKRNVVRERDGVILAFAGHIVEDERLYMRLGYLPGKRVLTDAGDLLLDLYLRAGGDALCDLNGLYTVAIWDENQRKLILINDRYGIQPCYYWHTKNRFLFATEKKSITTHPNLSRRINPAALFQFLATDLILDEHTLLEDVHALPPATMLTYQDDKIHLKRYWEMPLYQEETGSSQLDCLDHLGFLLKEAVHRRAKDNTSILMTAGLDSRILAGMLSLHQPALNVSANTIGHDLSMDVKFGGEIARMLGFDYTVLPVNPRYVADYSERCVTRTEGHMNCHAGWILQEDEYLQGNNFDYVMSGVGGEGISGRHWLAETMILNEEAAIQRMIASHWNFRQAAELFKPEFARDLWGESLNSIRRSIREANSDHVLSRYDYFHYRQTRRHPTGNVLSDYATILEPFYDNDLVDFALSLAPEMRVGGILYKSLLLAQFPHLAKVKYNDSGRTVEEDLNYKGSRVAVFYTRVQKRIKRQFQFSRRSPYGDNPYRSIYYNHWLRTESKTFVMEVLSRKELFGDYLAVEKVNQLVDDHMSGRHNRYRTICALVTFALWRKQCG